MSEELDQVQSEELTLDQIARKRGWQTAIQGLAIDVVVAVALVILATLPDATDWAVVRDNWPVVALPVSKSVVQAIAAWVVRRFADQSGFVPAEPKPTYSA